MANNPQKVAERIAKVKEEVALQAMQDDDFRAALLKDPKAALAAEYGLDQSFFAGFSLRVEVEKPDEVLLVIPGKAADEELSDDQLEAVAGGAAFVGGVAATLIVGAATIAQQTRAGRNW